MAAKMDGDWRHLANGLEIPTQSYSDQPYLIKTDDGAWLCCVTTGNGHEGAPGQHVSTMRSIDFGKTWSAPVSVEAPGDVENSYAVMLKVPPAANASGDSPSGRIYIFYNQTVSNASTHWGTSFISIVTIMAGHGRRNVTIFRFVFSNATGKISMAASFAFSGMSADRSPIPATPMCR